MKREPSTHNPWFGRPLSRRDALRAGGLGLTGASAALLLGCGGGTGSPAGAAPEGEFDGPPETTRLRVVKDYTLCLAPQYIAREFLIEEGFTDLEYVSQGKISQTGSNIASGTMDMSLHAASPAAVDIDEGMNLVTVAGVHSSCYEIFARDGINSIGDLRGKTVGVVASTPDEIDERWYGTFFWFIGIDPRRDLTMRPETRSGILRAYSDGSVDAVFAIPPTTEQLRTLGIGRVIFSSMVDRPAVGYQCCLLTVNRDFLERNPNATRRAIRAVLRGADVCAQEPERAAQWLIDNAFGVNYEYVLASVKSIPFTWRDVNAEDTLRYYALRLNEAGVIKNSPHDILRKGSDWRFFHQLKEEMAFAPTTGPLRASLFNCEVRPDRATSPTVPGPGS
jgi:NitT/TauT family transport system substrate-binding protein